MQGTPWWRGARGEWYVIAQLALMAAVFFGPRSGAGWPPWPPAFARVALLAGTILVVAGAWILLVSLFSLGANLTPLPHPKTGSTLIEIGPYRFVRHPMYAAGILVACGWALVVHGWLTLVYATALVALLDIKSRREERWLLQKFPGYADYRRRVRRFVPFVY